MDSFLTEAELLDFRAMTLLLQMGLKKWRVPSNSISDNSSKHGSEDHRRVQRDLSRFAALLVRSNEIVAIATERVRNVGITICRSLQDPEDDPKSQGEDENYSSRMLIARNPRRDEAKVVRQLASTIGKESEVDFDCGLLERQSNLEVLPEIAHNDFKTPKADIVELDSSKCARDLGSLHGQSFIEHVEICAGFLRQSAKFPAEEKASIETAMSSFSRYIVRACHDKMIQRACRATPSFRDRLEDMPRAKQNGNLQKITDFWELLRPHDLIKWKKIMRRSAPNEILLSTAYVTVLEAPMFTRPRKSAWKKVEWGDLSSLPWKNRKEIESYEPSHWEADVSNALESQGFDPLPRTKGFYLKAKGRKAYNAMLLNSVADALFHLKLIEQIKDRITGPLDNKDTDSVALCNELDKLVSSLAILHVFSHRSPLLEAHIYWMIRTELQLDRGNDKPSISNMAPNATELKEQAPEDEIFSEDRSHKSFELEEYADSSATLLAAEIINYLRLITNHIFVLLQLLRQSRRKSFRHLLQMPLHVLQITANPADFKSHTPIQEFLVVCLPGFSEADIAMYTRDLSSHTTNANTSFSGTWHAEVLIMSLYLLTRESLTHPQVTPAALEAAKRIFPFVFGISKRLCPICTCLFDVVGDILGHQRIYTPGSHDVITCCSLPPWLPRKYAIRVIERLKVLLSEQATDRLDELHRIMEAKLLAESDSSHGSSDPPIDSRPNSGEGEPPQESIKPLIHDKATESGKKNFGMRDVFFSTTWLKAHRRSKSK